MSLVKYVVISMLLATIITPTTTGYALTDSSYLSIDTSTPLIEAGTLSGYVRDTSMNPIPGARVRVSFHETYEENYSDSSGYYHVTNIPICYCIKNATCSKAGYQNESVWLVIVENTTHDFILTNLNQTCYPVFNGTLGTNGWYISCVNVSFVINGDIDELYYRMDYEEWDLYTVPFAICENGEHTFYWHYFSNGNMSDIFQMPLLIDRSIPLLNVSTERLSMNKIQITVNTTDDTSGINRVDFYQDSIFQYTDTTAPYVVIMISFGIHRVKVVTYDYAGNSAQSNFITSFRSHSLIHFFISNLRTDSLVVYEHNSISPR